MNQLTMHHVVCSSDMCHYCQKLQQKKYNLLGFNPQCDIALCSLGSGNTLHLYGSSSGEHWVISCQMKCRTAASLFDDHCVLKGETANSLRKFSHPPLLSFPHLHASIPTAGSETSRRERTQSPSPSPLYSHLPSAASDCAIALRPQLRDLVEDSSVSPVCFLMN